MLLVTHIDQFAIGVVLGSVQKLHHPGTREGGVSEKMILDYVGGGRGIAKDDG